MKQLIWIRFLPKIVGHARIENFFGIPTDFSNKKMNLYKITRLPLFVHEKQAVYTASLPRYLLLGEDGSSSEWHDHTNRRCILDENSRYMFCSIPVPIYSSIQHPCLRSIVLNTSTKNCLKETVDLSSPRIVKFAPNVHAVSVHTSLQCFEKGNKENKNVFSNIKKVAIIKTRCNSFVSCGSLDFSSVGGACDRAEAYILTFNNTYKNPFILDKSVNPIDVEMDNLSQIMDIPSLIESAISHKKHLEVAYTELQSNIHRAMQTRVWPKILIGIFILLSIVTICALVFTSAACLKRICRVFNCQETIDFLFHVCLKKKKRQLDNSSLNMPVHSAIFAKNDIRHNAMYQNKTKVDQLQPLLNKLDRNNLIQYPLHSNYPIRDISALNSKVDLDCLPSTTYISKSIDVSNILSSKIVDKTPNPAPRKIYNYMREISDSSSSHWSITSREFLEEDRESED